MANFLSFVNREPQFGGYTFKFTSANLRELLKKEAELQNRSNKIL